jgi:beta-galactosidase beta subunit
MVIDKKENERLYYGLHKGFEEAFAFIAKAVKENLPVGRYEVNDFYYTNFITQTDVPRG